MFWAHLVVLKWAHASQSTDGLSSTLNDDTEDNWITVSFVWQRLLDIVHITIHSSQKEPCSCCGDVLNAYPLLLLRCLMLTRAALGLQLRGWLQFGIYYLQLSFHSCWMPRFGMYYNVLRAGLATPFYLYQAIGHWKLYYLSAMLRFHVERMWNLLNLAFLNMEESILCSPSDFDLHAVCL